MANAVAKYIAKKPILIDIVEPWDFEAGFQNPMPTSYPCGPNLRLVKDDMIEL